MVRNANTHGDSDVESRAERSYFRESLSAHDRALESDRSVYLPGDFRYLPHARSHIQDALDGAGSPKSRTSSMSLIHLSDDQVPFPPGPRTEVGVGERPTMDDRQQKSS